MKSVKSGNNTSDGSMREYAPTQECINNIPYAGMILLGMVIFIASFSGSAWGTIAAGLYLLYGIAGTLWIMFFVCPFCRYWNTRACPCGYGRLAAKFTQQSDTECFSEKFKKHIPVIVPLWFLPLLAGIAGLIIRFSWLMTVLLVIFALEAFVVLPLVSTQHGCRECPQKETCPWMKRKSGQTARIQEEKS